MKLYFSPGACSLATRISLHEAGIAADFEQVDLKAKRTASGLDFAALNPAGCVPLIILDDGEAVAENVAILSLLADLAPHLSVEGPLGRTRLIEMLSFLSTELHIAFKPYFHGATGNELAAAREAVLLRLNIVAQRMHGPYLFGDNFTVADAYLFVMLRWAKNHEIALPPQIADLFDRIATRTAVRQAIEEEEGVLVAV